MLETIKDIARILREEDDFLVTAHVSPDGDAIGSMAALCWMLTRLGKRACAYNVSGVPHYLSWLPFPCTVYTDLETLPFAPRRVIVLDSGSASRAGDAMEAYLGTVPSICIDHHLKTPEFASINWIDPTYSSVGEMLAVLADHLAVVLTEELGEAIYLAMSSDTGNFSYGNTLPRTLEIAAEVLRRGLDLEKFTARAEATWSLNKVHLWGRLFDSVHLALDGQVAYMTLPDSLFAETGTSMEDAEGIVNFLRRIHGVKVALTLRDAEAGSTKISLRTHGDLNVQEVAASFGGGGHKNAAGATLGMPIPEALQAVLAELAEKLLLDSGQA